MTITTSRSLKEEELHALWQFYDRDKNNFLSKDEIGQLLERLKKKEGIETKLSDSFVSSVFNLIDKNGDGMIDWEEFKNYFNDFLVNRGAWFSQVSKSLNTPIHPVSIIENRCSCTEELKSPLNQSNNTNILSVCGSGDKTNRDTNRSRGISISMQVPQATNMMFSPRDNILNSSEEIKQQISLDNKSIERAEEKIGNGEFPKTTENTFLNPKFISEKDESQKHKLTEKMFDKVFVRDLKYIKPELHTQEINEKLIAKNLTNENINLLGDKSESFRCPNCNKPIDTSYVLNYFNCSISGNCVMTKNNTIGNSRGSSLPCVNFGIESFDKENIKDRWFMANECNATNFMKGKIYGKIPQSFIHSPYNVHTWLLK